MLQYEASNMQIEAPQRLSTAIIQLPVGDSVVEAMVDLQVEPPAVISWDQVQLCICTITLEPIQSRFAAYFPHWQHNSSVTNIAARCVIILCLI